MSKEKTKLVPITRSKGEWEYDKKVLKGFVQGSIVLNKAFGRITAHFHFSGSASGDEITLKKGDKLIRLKSGDIVAPFSGVLGYTGLTEDILVSNNIFIITLDDNSIIYSDIKIPESYSTFIKKGLPIEVTLSSF